jgi:hypothetical protein
MNFPWPFGHPRTMKIALLASPSPPPSPTRGEGVFEDEKGNMS